MKIERCFFWQFSWAPCRPAPPIGPSAAGPSAMSLQGNRPLKTWRRAADSPLDLKTPALATPARLLSAIAVTMGARDETEYVFAGYHYRKEVWATRSPGASTRLGRRPARHSTVMVNGSMPSRPRRNFLLEAATGKERWHAEMAQRSER